ncbi:MAG: ERCC4 domain-containing protein [Clostridia bacterium]
MNIQIDSREKAKAIKKIIKEFDKNKIEYIVSKLYVGDYMNYDNPRLIIDRKQNLNELCGNVIQQHKRFKNEIERANKMGIKIIFLVEHGEDITCLKDIIKWYNPRLRVSPRALRGVTLFKILTTLKKENNCDFVFCNKNETGKKIIELLKNN